jgi:hypothetical protein
LPTGARRLEGGDDIWIDPQLDVLLDGRFLRSALTPVTFDGGLIQVGRKNVFCRACPGKILTDLTKRPVPLFRTVPAFIFFNDSLLPIKRFDALW